MRDAEFLRWLWFRLVDIHKESPNLDYMYKLKSIAKALPPNQVTPNIANGWED